MLLRSKAERCRALPRPPGARRTGDGRQCPLTDYQELPLGRRAGLASSVPEDETARAVGCLWHVSP
jgi:hypothetical protein